MSKFSKWAGHGRNVTRTRAAKPSRTPPPTMQEAPTTAQTVTLYTSDGRPVHLTQSPLPAQDPRQPQLVARQQSRRIVHPQQVRPPRS